MNPGDVPPPVYRGQFGRAQAERLLWRAGFGPRPGEADRLAPRACHGAVLALTHPAASASPGRRRPTEGPPARAERRLGPRPALVARPHGAHTNRPLVERMTLVWHDWFATSMSGVGSQRADGASEPALPPLLARLVQEPAPRRYGRPRDDPVAQRRQHEPQGPPERELRARADGALHPRGRPRLHARTTSASRRGRSPAGGASRIRPADVPVPPASTTTPAPRESSARRGRSTGATRVCCA